MLLAFSVQNFKSIRDLQTLSLEARSDEHLARSHVVTDGKLRVVKSAVLYGANASGKSNVIEALVWFRKFVLTSSKEGQAGEDIPVQPFLLSSPLLVLPLISWKPHYASVAMLPPSGIGHCISPQSHGGV
jgi:AAA15 family ATPase/GTPase